MLGKAMDFYIPGVKLATLRGLAMQMQVGGVGYYPTSGSPFVHLDVGNVRAWPRMSRQELARLFPGGRTLHLPADGRPLPGYEVVVADQKKRVRPLAIQSARTDDDDDAGSGAIAPDEVTGSLVAALLPIPRGRAENGLARQLGRQADENSDDRPVPAIVSMRVPRPTLRPERSDGSVASTPSDVAPVVFASIVVGRSMAGELHVTDRAKNSITNRIATMQPVPSVPGAALRQLSAGVGAISTRALVAWALQPPGIAIDMTAPSLPGVHRPEEHAESEDDDSVVKLSEDRFNDKRFGIEG
jgi:hypothetical protein